jgi:hypothetical protein
MKKLALGLALCLAAACASEKKSAISDPSAPKAKAECCEHGGDCSAKDKASCSEKDAKTCPMADKKVQG